MKRATVLEQVKTPDGSTMALVERDGEYVIRVNGRELMSTRHSFSEEQLGVVACQKRAQLRGARVLIGGLGLGFTLRAALATLARDARVIVAELVPEVVDWNRNTSYALAAAALADPRTHVVIGDVANIMLVGETRSPRRVSPNIEEVPNADMPLGTGSTRPSPAQRGRGEPGTNLGHEVLKLPDTFHAIMLDADNQTTSMNTAGNTSLYHPPGIAKVWRKLEPGGTVVYWSAGEDPVLAKRLASGGFDVEVQRVRKHPNGGGHHILLVGHRRG